MIGKFGDVLIFDGREPHRASLLKKMDIEQLSFLSFLQKKIGVFIVSQY